MCSTWWGEASRHVIMIVSFVFVVGVLLGFFRFIEDTFDPEEVIVDRGDSGFRCGAGLEGTLFGFRWCFSRLVGCGSRRCREFHVLEGFGFGLRGGILPAIDSFDGVFLAQVVEERTERGGDGGLVLAGEFTEPLELAFRDPHVETDEGILERACADGGHRSQDSSFVVRLEGARISAASFCLRYGVRAMSHSSEAATASSGITWESANRMRSETGMPAS